MNLYVNENYIKDINNFDIEQIANSGQVFRVTKEEKGYRFLSKDKSIYINQKNNNISFNCSLEDYKDYWEEYFDLNTNYEDILNKINSNDEFLQKCYFYGNGIRILKQDLFETIISFIISQRKSIPAIKSCIETLCKKFGKLQIDVYGKKYYSFPTYEDLKEISLNDLQGLSLGYRDKYIYQLIRDLHSNQLNLIRLKKNTKEEQEKKLLEIYGVGKKVMNCISLFSLHNLNAFPIDIWIQRILDEKYEGTFPYTEYQGLLQQYIFFYALNHKKEFKK